MTRDSIWLDIVTERYRQERLLAEGKFDRSMADPALSPPEKLVVCSEEFGEVARIVCESIVRTGERKPSKPLDEAHLREELIQLAACCVAWVEQLDNVPPIPAVPYRDDGGDNGLPIEVFVVQPGAA